VDWVAVSNIIRGHNIMLHRGFHGLSQFPDNAIVPHVLEVSHKATATLATAFRVSILREKELSYV